MWFLSPDWILTNKITHEVNLDLKFGSLVVNNTLLKDYTELKQNVYFV